MKTTRLTFALLTTCAALPVSGLLAQAPSAPVSATPSVSAPAATATTTDDETEGDGKMRARLATLTTEEKMKLRAAHNAAMKDPTVQAAKAERSTDKRAFQKTVREAMIKADPSVEPILAKLREERKEERHAKKNG